MDRIKRLAGALLTLQRGSGRNNPLPAIVFGVAVIVFGLGSFATWSAVAEISSAIIASGTLKVSTSRKKVQPLEGGVVREIAVQNGVKVNVGDILVRLDDTQARASFGILQQNYDLLRATVARLRAELQSSDKIEYPAGLLERADLASVSDIIEGQGNVFDARRKTLQGQAEMIRNRIDRLEDEIVGLLDQSATKTEQMEIIAQENTDLKKLLKKGLVQRSRVHALSREALRLKGEKGEHETGVARTRRLIAEAELEVIQLRRNFEKEVSDELGAKETEMLALAERVAAAEHKVHQSVVRATESGIVVNLDIHTLGGVVQPGATLLEIVPIRDQLLVEAHIRPIDIDSVSVGLDAEIMFSAFSQKKNPKLTGSIAYVSADVLTDARTGAPYFLAQISVDKDELEKLSDSKLLPGMPADVFIKTGTRTPLAYLMQPLRDSFSKAWREP